MWVALAEFCGQRLKHGLGLCDERGKVLIEEPFGLISGGLGIFLLVWEACLVDSRSFIYQCVQSFIKLFVVKLIEKRYVLFSLWIDQAGAFFGLIERQEGTAGRSRSLRLDYVSASLLGNKTRNIQERCLIIHVITSLDSLTISAPVPCPSCRSASRCRRRGWPKAFLPFPDGPRPWAAIWLAGIRENRPYGLFG